MCLGVPGQVVELLGEPPQHARVDLDGRLAEVSVMVLDRVQVGDWVIVHQGFALDRVDAEQARDILAARHEMLETYARELSER